MSKKLVKIYSQILAIVMMFILASVGTAMATVWTDQLDYTPGSIVTIHGDNSDHAGYQSGETVNVSVNGPYQYDSSCSGIADSNRAWSCKVTLSSDYTAEGNYTYTAVGKISDVTQIGTFTDANVIHFIESGLPSGTDWNVAFTGGNKNYKNSTTNTISFGSINSGTYSYSIGSPISGGEGTIYVASPSSGNITISGSNIDENINFVTQYQVSFDINPSGSGSTNPPSVNYYNAGSTISISATANAGYVFSLWSNTSSITLSSATSSSTIATINGPGTITATFVLADTTPPTSTITLDPASPNGNNDWYTQDIKVTISAVDNAGGSGMAETRCVLDPASEPTSFDAIPTGCAYTGAGASITTEGLHTIYFASKDINNNTESPQNRTFKIDKTAPTLDFGTATPAANAAGWNKDDVSVPFTVTEPLSGLDTTSSTPSPLTLTTEGSAVTGTITLIDKADNSATFTSPTFKIDKTAPTITGTRTPAPNANGWNNGDVTVRFTCNDETSGISSCTPDIIVSTEGSGQSVTGTAIDQAGNSASVTVGNINIDKTPPIITASASTSDGVYTYGTWTNKDVTVSFSCSDDRSGIASCDSLVTISGEGSDQSATGNVIDKAGNIANVTFSKINIDKTAPTTTDNSPADWQNQDFTITLTCTDNTGGSGCKQTQYSIDSGPYQIYITPISITAEGDHTITYSSVDNADNTETAKTVHAKPDKTAPTTTDNSPSTWQNADFTITLTCTDNTGGSGCKQTQYSIDGGALQIGTSVSISTEGDHTITYSSVDNAGNAEISKTVHAKLDKTTPTISLTTTPTPINGNYILNQPVVVNYNCNDAVSGVASCIGKNANGVVVANGVNIDTSNVGTKSFTVISTDYAGNTKTTSITYNVTYAYSGILQPINADGSSIFKLGSTVPVKFQLKDYYGNYIVTAVATISVAEIDNGIEGTYIEATSTSAASTGNQFRYDSTSNQYIFNLATKPLTQGTWSIKIYIDDGTTKDPAAKISLK